MNTSALARSSMTPSDHRPPRPAKRTVGQSWPGRVRRSGPRPRGDTVAPMRMKVLVGVVVVLAGLGVFAVVRDSGNGSGNKSSALTASEHKYCTLVKQFKDH